jgi:hypothetical protein
MIVSGEPMLEDAPMMTASHAIAVHIHCDALQLRVRPHYVL